MPLRVDFINEQTDVLIEWICQRGGTNAECLAILARVVVCLLEGIEVEARPPKVQRLYVALSEVLDQLEAEAEAAAAEAALEGEPAPRRVH